MKFDLEAHQIKEYLRTLGQTLLPGEKDVGKLIKAASEATGIPYKKISSKTIHHLPTPLETGPYYQCPSCSQKKMIISELCPSCSQSEGGKFLTQTTCTACKEIKKYPHHLGALYNHLGIDFNSSTKQNLGVKLIKDPEPTKKGP